MLFRSGQPVQPARIRNWVDLKSLRAAALYEEDKNLPIRKSHENPVLKQIYKEFLKTPGSHVAHQVLHTSYRKLDRFHSGGPAAAGTPSPALRA